MKRLLPFIAIVLLLFVGVSTFGVTVVSADGSPYTDPLVYDWLNNNTSDSDSHVSNYSIETPHQYFSGGLAESQSISDALNESGSGDQAYERLYEVYDSTYERYPTEDVYENWNANNVYDYGQRTYVPEFKKQDTVNTNGGSTVNVGVGQKTMRDGWTGIYSVHPSTYAHFGPPDENDSSDYYGVSSQLTDDTITVYAATNADVGSIPNTEEPIRNFDGAIRRQYSFDRFEREATLFINRTDDCLSRCEVATDSNVNQVAEFNDVDISNYVDKGESYEIIVQTTHTIVYDVDIDEQNSYQVEVDCPANQNNPPCYATRYEWLDDRTTESSHFMKTNGSQNMTLAGGLNKDSDTVNDEIEYRRGVFPNGTTKLYLNTTGMDGFETDDPVWRRIEIGDEYVQSPWEVWASQNTSWKFMFEDSDSNEKTQSHTRPLTFHTAPMNNGLETSSGVSYRQTEQQISFGGWSNSQLTYTESSYDSPELLRHHSCKYEYPEHKNNPQDAWCGWILEAAGNEVTYQSYAPYLTVEDVGDWQAYNQIYITAPDTASESGEITMYGLTPNSSVELEADRTVDIKPTEIYMEKINDTIGEEGVTNAYVGVKLTLVNSETNERIDTSTDSENYIRVENAEVVQTGEDSGEPEYGPRTVNTNESGEVTVRVYDVKDSGIEAAFYTENWSTIEDGEVAYEESELDEGISITALPMARFLQYIGGIFAAIFIIISISVRMMHILNIETSTTKELQKFLPDSIGEIIVWTILIYFILTVLS